MLPLVIVYLIAMMALFLFANIVYLVIEYAYRSGILRTSLRGTLR